MNRFMKGTLILIGALTWGSAVPAQGAGHERLGKDLLDVRSPEERVRGIPGQMGLRPIACHHASRSEVRRRIVDIAVQEWGYFGFPIVDLTDFDGDVSLTQLLASDANARIPPMSFQRLRRGGRFPPLPVDEARRVASTVGGYWAATPQGGTMIARQNREWSGPQGVTGRWADPWSAAFISWVMCEAGLAETDQFQRAIAHWSYIDQAIKARDGGAARSAFVAYEIGEEEILPGDLLCSGRRPSYQTIAQRRRQLGIGARTHCDVVVKVDDATQTIFAIGGNVRRSVSLKMFAATPNANGHLQPARPSLNHDMRPLFAHLKLNASKIELNALDNSPTMKNLNCRLSFEDRHPGYNLRPLNLTKGEC